MMYLPECMYGLSLVANFYTLFKICKLSKMFPEDVEINKALKHLENVALLKVTISLALCTLFYMLYFFFGFNDALIVLTMGIWTFYTSFVYDDVKDVSNMVDVYRSDLKNFKE